MCNRFGQIHSGDPYHLISLWQALSFALNQAFGFTVAKNEMLCQIVTSEMARPPIIRIAFVSDRPREIFRPATTMPDVGAQWLLLRPVLQKIS